MYIPPAFQEEDPSAIAATMANYGFATLITVRGDCVNATHLPLLFDAHRGERGLITGHVARANPQAADLAEGKPATAIFLGPHAYISPRWYETAEAVPTWNYVAVHAEGIPRVIEEPERVTEYLEALTAQFEGDRPDAWRPGELRPELLEGLCRSIVAFELPVRRMEAKSKLNQNRTAADRAGVIRNLEESPDHLGREIARLMSERQPR